MLNNVEWKNVKLAKRGVEEEVLELKEQSGKDILVGSPALIITLAKLNLIDETNSVFTVIVGHGLPLFKNISDRTILKLLKTKPLTLVQ